MILFNLVLLFAASATFLFFYGAWALIRHPGAVRKRLEEIGRALHVMRDDRNPLLSPQDSHWEADGVFNPAAVEIDGVTHLFYRAVGRDGVSRVGYAVAKDGESFSRLPYPVFALSDEDASSAAARKSMVNHVALVASGGSWAGTEDPRAVVIDDNLYLTFSAFGGWDSLRMGVSSLSLEDLRKSRWKWTPPVYLSPRGQVHKNWVLFPEKIHGKFAVLHSLHGGSRDRVLVEYLDSLDKEPAEHIQSSYAPEPEDAAWDSMVRGAGPPPLKTPHGWLVLYHAIDTREPSRYKLGAMLLDLDDPSIVKARSLAPVLAPDASYENSGAKPGIVYACGATLSGDVLTVYYGAADSVVCAARHSLAALLDQLVAPRMETYPSVPVLKMPIVA